MTWMTELLAAEIDEISTGRDRPLSRTEVLSHGDDRRCGVTRLTASAHRFHGTAALQITRINGANVLTTRP